MDKNSKKNVYIIRKEMKDVKQTPKMELLVVDVYLKEKKKRKKKNHCWD